MLNEPRIQRRRAHRLPVAVLGAVALLVGLGAGSAYAYFTSRGSGTGASNAGNPLSVTVVAATATPSTNLLPGGSADLVIQLTNPNSYPVTLVAISQSGTAVTPVGTQGPGTACTSANTGVSVTSRTGLSVAVASGTNVVVHLAGAVSMNTSSASGCQGLSFQIPMNVTVQR